MLQEIGKGGGGGVEGRGVIETETGRQWGRLTGKYFLALQLMHGVKEFITEG